MLESVLPVLIPRVSPRFDNRKGLYEPSLEQLTGQTRRFTSQADHSSLVHTAMVILRVWMQGLFQPHQTDL